MEYIGDNGEGKEDWIGQEKETDTKGMEIVWFQKISTLPHKKFFSLAHTPTPPLLKF